MTNYNFTTHFRLSKSERISKFKQIIIGTAYFISIVALVGGLTFMFENGFNPKLYLVFMPYALFFIFMASALLIFKVNLK